MSARLRRIVLSEWMGLPLTLLIAASLAVGLHEQRPSTIGEESFMYSSIALTAGWLMMWLWSRRQTNRRT
jgi:hypothetical protein